MVDYNNPNINSLTSGINVVIDLSDYGITELVIGNNYFTGDLESKLKEAFSKSRTVCLKIGSDYYPILKDNENFLIFYGRILFRCWVSGYTIVVEYYNMPIQFKISNPNMFPDYIDDNVIVYNDVAATAYYIGLIKECIKASQVIQIVGSPSVSSLSKLYANIISYYDNSDTNVSISYISNCEMVNGVKKLARVLYTATFDSSANTITIRMDLLTI